MTLLWQNREKCLAFEFILCVGRYDLLQVLHAYTGNNLTDYYAVILNYVTYTSY